MNAFCVVEGQVIKQLQFLEWFWISEMSSDNSSGPDLEQAFLTSTLLTFGVEKFFGVCVCVCVYVAGGALLCIVRYSVASLASTHWMPAAPSPPLTSHEEKPKMSPYLVKCPSKSLITSG